MQNKVEKVESHRPIVMEKSRKARVSPELEMQSVFRKQPVADERGRDQVIEIIKATKPTTVSN